MTVAEKQQALIDRYLLIPDPHERLSAVIARKPALAPLADSERIDANRVRGCMSRVWLGFSLEKGRCRLRVGADSPMVRGLVSLLCELYDSGAPEEVASVEPRIFDALGISKNLTPTRLNGLASVRSAIRERAEHCLADP
jgi:cysteine desulfuration protein SufE